jgi:hypothetical protein
MVPVNSIPTTRNKVMNLALSFVMLAPVMDVSFLFVKKIVKCGEMEGYREKHVAHNVFQTQI